MRCALGSECRCDDAIRERNLSREAAVLTSGISGLPLVKISRINDTSRSVGVGKNHRFRWAKAARKVTEIGLLPSSESSLFWPNCGCSGQSTTIVAVADASYAGLNRVLRPISGGAYDAPRQVNALATAGTFRVPFIVAVDAGNLRLEYGHLYQQTTTPGGDIDPPAALSFSASVEIAGTIFRATFAGRTTATIDPGGVVRSDPIGVEVTAGQTIFVRTYLASGPAYGNRTNFNNPGGRYTNDIVGGEGFASLTDLTAPGSAAVADNEANRFAPQTILGDTASALPVVIGSGDSIMAGQGDSNDAGEHINANNAGGWFERAFTGVGPHINLSKPGEKAAEFVVPANHLRRTRHITPGVWVMCAYGRNDVVNAPAQIKGALVAHWFSCTRRGRA